MKRIERLRPLLPAAGVVLCAWLCGFSLSTLLERGGEMGQILGKLFPADLGYLFKVLPPLLETLRMSLLGTAVGAVLALPLTGLCSRCASGHPRMAAVLRSIIHLLRAIPVLVVALLCSFVWGTGSFAGAFAIALYSLGLLARMGWEAVEHGDLRPMEVLCAAGCGRWRAFWRACLPQVLPGYLSDVLYVLEANVRHAAILGYVGAGGLGILLNEKIAWREWSRVGTILLLLYLVVFAVETLSSWLRRLLEGKVRLSRNSCRCLWCLTALALVWSAATIAPPSVTEGGLKVFRGILSGLLHPDWSLLWNFTKKGVPYLCLETLAMTVAGTAIGAAVSVPIAMLGSRNISGPWWAGIWKQLLLALRTLPAIVTGLLFIRVTGPGSFAGLLTLSVLSVSMCCKLYIGALDAMDLRAVHALEAMGCGRLAVLRRGVWPQAKAPMLSAALYRFDVNLREAAVLGLVGAGGLGTPLLFAMNGYLWSQAAAYLLGLLVLVLAAGAVADRTRRRLG